MEVRWMRSDGGDDGKPRSERYFLLGFDAVYIVVD
jgi:hypothetical protein